MYRRWEMLFGLVLEEKSEQRKTFYSLQRMTVERFSMNQYYSLVLVTQKQKCRAIALKVHTHKRFFD